MPVVLMQHFSPGDRVYLDVEGSLYHYPKMYFTRIQAYDNFIYYRPLGASARRSDSKTYFGYGVLGVPFPDAKDSNRFFVPIERYARFPRVVPLKDPQGIWYETGTTTTFAAQSAVRHVSDIAFHRILAAAGAAVTGVSQLPSTDEIVASAYVGRPIAYPKDELREATAIPAGAGYKPHGDRILDVYESAALQERARADHQGVLTLIADQVIDRGGRFLYNNNIDLLAEIDGSKVLVEAKSLNNTERAVDRMRYGIGQLTDYSFRYRDEIGAAQKMLAFGRPPDEATSWVATVLQEADIAFVALDEGKLRPLNALARSSPLLR
jgi:hypothetical protein